MAVGNKVVDHGVRVKKKRAWWEEITSVRGGGWGRDEGDESVRQESLESSSLVSPRCRVRACDSSTPVIRSKVTRPQCDSVAQWLLDAAFRPPLRFRMNHLSLLSLERFLFLCSHLSAPKRTLVNSTSPPHKGCRRLNQSIWWADILIRWRNSPRTSVHNVLQHAWSWLYSLVYRGEGGYKAITYRSIQLEVTQKTRLFCIHKLTWAVFKCICCLAVISRSFTICLTYN